MTNSITKVDRILTNATVITMDAQWQVFSPGAIAITGSAIVTVGPAAEISAAYQAETTDNFSGKTIIPGLVNAHTHAPMTLLRGLADDLRLDVWLLGYMMPVERAFLYFLLLVCGVVEPATSEIREPTSLILRRIEPTGGWLDAQPSSS